MWLGEALLYNASLSIIILGLMHELENIVSNTTYLFSSKICIKKDNTFVKALREEESGR